MSNLQDKFQYHVYNEHINLLVTVPVDTEEYAISFAKRTSMDFYDATEDQVQELECDRICAMWMESVVNINLLNKPSNIKTKKAKKTVMSTLEVGTKFYVINGHWDGEIIEINGVKYVKVSGPDGNLINLEKDPEYELSIDIKE